MKKTLLILTVLLAAIFASQAQPLNYTYAQRLNVVFDSVCARFNIKGASAAVIVPGEGTWERCYGVSHTGTPINSDMYLGIGSNTKTYFATLLLKLQEQGKLDLDDTIGTWVQHPNIPGSITIRQCLNHTSGLYSFTNNSKMNDYILNDFTKIWPIDTVLNLVEPPVAAPGGAWDYCNTNYLVAGLIIRSVTGKDVQTALRDEILTPQGLNKTHLFPQEQPAGVIPHAWSSNLTTAAAMEDLIAVHGYSHNAFYSLATSAGALFTTAMDNAMFWDKLMSGKIINSASMAEQQTGVPFATGQTYGLGAFMSSGGFNGRNIICHGGTAIGFINENAHDMTNHVTISILTNQDSISNGILLNNCIRAMHRVTMQYTDVDDIVIMDAPAIEVYPNPAGNTLNISTEEQGTLEIYSVTGSKVAAQPLQVGVNTVSLRDVQSGTYYARVSIPGQAVFNKMIQVIK